MWEQNLRPGVCFKQVKFIKISSNWTKCEVWFTQNFRLLWGWFRQVLNTHVLQ